MLSQSSASPAASRPKRVFLSYCHADEGTKKLFLMALRPLEYEGHIAAYHDRMIMAGQDWDREIDTQLQSADVILFLVSEGFLKSRYCREIEVKAALDREGKGEAFVIPIIVSDCPWRDEVFARLQALPPDGKPLLDAKGSVDAGLLEGVIEALRLAVLGLWDHSSARTIPGATLGAQSEVSSSREILQFGPSIQFQRRTQPYTPTRLTAMRVEVNEPWGVNFVVNTGNSGLSGESLQREAEKVTAYFWESVAVAGENNWVNLSPFESNRMLPAPLGGTRLGRSYLETDLKLKELSASLLHPDCDTGKAYWKELYARARSRFGTSILPFSAFHKVCIVPVEAKIFQRPSNHPDWRNMRRGFDKFASEGLDAEVVSVVKSTLSASCESDFAAFTHASNTASSAGAQFSSRDAAVNDLALEVFRDIVRPVIEDELNFGRFFAETRQHYHSQILAVWFKKHVKTMRGAAEHYGRWIDCNHPETVAWKVEGLTALQPKESQEAQEQPPHAEAPIDNVNPSDPAFAIPENAEFYQRYIRLFRKGLYRVARSERGDRDGEIVNRVYFSGAMDFGSLTTLWSEQPGPPLVETRALMTSRRGSTMSTAKSTNKNRTTTSISSIVSP
jgi:hypothetical protein